MKSHSVQHSLFTSLSSLFLLIMGYVLLAPTQLGGAVTYVIVDGNSMEPAFHLGDLVLVRAQASYQPGDAVTYQNAELGRYVFHRIMSMNLGRFVLQGDNNSWLDTYQPSQDEIIGKLWVHIPKLGRAIEWVRTPLHMAFSVALLGGVLMSDLILKPNQSRRKKNNPSGSPDLLPPGSLYIAGFLVLVFLALTIFSFTQPLTRSSGNTPYQQTGDFVYSATGTAGVYDTALVRPGEPIFPKLTCFMNVGFTYNLTGSGLGQVNGSQQMFARVSDAQSGWQRTIPMSQTTAFGGSSYFATSTLDLCQVQSLVSLVEQETGLHPNTYTLEIITHVEFAGSLAGNAVSDTFDPTLVFKFDKAHFYLAPAAGQVDPLHSTKAGIAGNPNPQANTLSVGGLNLDIRMLRVICLLGLSFSVLGLSLIGILFYNIASPDQEARIRLKYGALLVDIFERDLELAASIININSMEDLVKLAERHGSMILHMKKGAADHYLVQYNGTAYRHIIGTDSDAVTQTIPVELKQVHALSRPKANPMPRVSQNKTVKRVTAFPVPIPVEHQTVEFTSVEQNEIAQWKKGNQPVAMKDGTVWDDIQNKIETSNPLKKQERILREAVPQRTKEYVIQSGAIEFFSVEPSETVMLDRVRI
jgi:signal peptidase I